MLEQSQSNTTKPLQAESRGLLSKLFKRGTTLDRDALKAIRRSSAHDWSIHKDDLKVEVRLNRKGFQLSLIGAENLESAKFVIKTDSETAEHEPDSKISRSALSGLRAKINKAVKAFSKDYGGLSPKLHTHQPWELKSHNASESSSGYRTKGRLELKLSEQVTLSITADYGYQGTAALSPGDPHYEAYVHQCIRQHQLDREYFLKGGGSSPGYYDRPRAAGPVYIDFNPRLIENSVFMASHSHLASLKNLFPNKATRQFPAVHGEPASNLYKRVVKKMGYAT